MKRIIYVLQLLIFVLSGTSMAMQPMPPRADDAPQRDERGHNNARADWRRNWREQRAHHAARMAEFTTDYENLTDEAFRAIQQLNERRNAEGWLQGNDFYRRALENIVHENFTIAINFLKQSAKLGNENARCWLFRHARQHWALVEKEDAANRQNKLDKRVSAKLFTKFAIIRHDINTLQEQAIRWAAGKVLTDAEQGYHAGLFSYDINLDTYEYTDTTIEAFRRSAQGGCHLAREWLAYNAPVVWLELNEHLQPRPPNNGSSASVYYFLLNPWDETNIWLDTDHRYYNAEERLLNVAKRVRQTVVWELAFFTDVVHYLEKVNRREELVEMYQRALEFVLEDNNFQRALHLFKRLPRDKAWLRFPGEETWLIDLN